MIFIRATDKSRANNIPLLRKLHRSRRSQTNDYARAIRHPFPLSLHQDATLWETFKVHHIDDNTRIFINKLSSLNAHYRTISVEYSNLIHLLRQNFTEKKAMTALYKLEKVTIELVKVNRDIVSLSKEFDSRWS